MEDLKQIQEFFLNENVFVEAFKLEKALKGMGYNVKVKYLDDFGKDIFEIYFNNPADADDDSIFYDVKKLGYDNFRVFANPQESLKEDKKLTLNDFVRMVRDDMMAGSSPDDHISDEQVRKRAKSYYNEYLKGASVDDLFEYNAGIYYNPDEKNTADKTKDAAKSGMERVKDMLKKIMTEEEGYSKYLKTDDNPEGKTKGLDTKTMNKILMNVIKDLDETIQLGKNLEEGKLCKKGEAYRKRRMAAGEKSSAYLSGRAVKVCKGQMSGKKKK
tara:strand:+ start:1184 stop:1999 length:816 start_codon:yes stop_codon:yes gene_type:complete